MIFLSVLAGSLVGTLFANLGLFWIIGSMAQKQEKKQLEEVKKLQQEFLEMRAREVERMRRYATMEG